jgi:hypothetical protein
MIASILFSTIILYLTYFPNPSYILVCSIAMRLSASSAFCASLAALVHLSAAQDIAFFFDNGCQLEAGNEKLALNQVIGYDAR